MYSSVLTCNEESFRSIIEREALDSESLLQQIAEDGTTLLMATAASGCQSILQILLGLLDLESGVEHQEYIEAMAFHGMNALMIASAAGHADVVKTLVDVGHANVNAVHKFSATSALHMVTQLE